MDLAKWRTCTRRQVRFLHLQAPTKAIKKTQLFLTWSIHYSNNSRSGGLDPKKRSTSFLLGTRCGSANLLLGRSAFAASILQGSDFRSLTMSMLIRLVYTSGQRHQVCKRSRRSQPTSQTPKRPKRQKEWQLSTSLFFNKGSGLASFICRNRCGVVCVTAGLGSCTGGDLRSTKPTLIGLCTLSFFRLALQKRESGVFAPASTLASDNCKICQILGCSQLFTSFRDHIPAPSNRSALELL